MTATSTESDSPTADVAELRAQVEAAKAASRPLSQAGTDQKNSALAHLADALRHLIERNIQGTRDMAGLVFPGSPHVDDDRPGFRFAPLVKLGGADAWSHRGLIALGFPGQGRASQQSTEQSN